MKAHKDVANRIPPDLADWIEGVGLHQRLSQMTKNITAAVADAVVFAEIINAFYPKIIQLHNYSDQSNVNGRIANWTTLNRKVLRVIRCEVSDQQISDFANRQSAAAVVDFLYYFRSKLIAFEPIYVSGQYASDMTAHLQMKTSVVPSLSSTENKSSSQSLQSSNSPNNRSIQQQSNRSTSPSSRSTTSFVSSHTATSFATTKAERRPSMKVNDELLKGRKERENVSRRASLISKNDMDALYRKFTTKIQSEEEELTRKNDNMLEKSQSLDAKFTALREQNKEEMLKTERRLSQVKTELSSLENGTSISLLDDETLQYLNEPNRVVEISKQLRRISIAASTLRPEEYEYGSSADNSFQDDDGDSPYRGGNKGRVGEGGGRGMLYSHNMLFNEKGRGGESDDEDASEEEESDEDDEDDDDDVPPPPPPVALPAKNKTAEAASTPTKQQQAVITSSSRGIQENSAKMTMSAVVPVRHVPPTPPSNVSPPRVVNYIRSFNEDHKCYFYTLVRHTDGVLVADSDSSQWTPPSHGVVQCKDESGNTYYTDTATGKSVWKLSDFDV